MVSSSLTNACNVQRHVGEKLFHGCVRKVCAIAFIHLQGLRLMGGRLSERDRQTCQGNGRLFIDDHIGQYLKIPHYQVEVCSKHAPNFGVTHEASI